MFPTQNSFCTQNLSRKPCERITKPVLLIKISQEEARQMKPGLTDPVGLQCLVRKGGGGEGEGGVLGDKS